MQPARNYRPALAWGGFGLLAALVTCLAIRAALLTTPWVAAAAPVPAPRSFARFPVKAFDGLRIETISPEGSIRATLQNTEDTARLESAAVAEYYDAAGKALARDADGVGELAPHEIRSFRLGPIPPGAVRAKIWTDWRMSIGHNNRDVWRSRPAPEGAGAYSSDRWPRPPSQ